MVGTCANIVLRVRNQVDHSLWDDADWPPWWDSEIALFIASLIRRSLLSFPSSSSPIQSSLGYTYCFSNIGSKSFTTSPFISLQVNTPSRGLSLATFPETSLIPSPQVNLFNTYADVESICQLYSYLQLAL